MFKKNYFATVQLCFSFWSEVLINSTLKFSFLFLVLLLTKTFPNCVSEQFFCKPLTMLFNDSTLAFSGLQSQHNPIHFFPFSREKLRSKYPLHSNFSNCSLIFKKSQGITGKISHNTREFGQNREKRENWGQLNASIQYDWVVVPNQFSLGFW